MLFRSQGLRKSGAVAQEYRWGEWGSDQGLRIGTDWDDLPLDVPEVVVVPDTPLPQVFSVPADAPEALPGARSPSDLGGAKALAGEAGDDTEAAMLRGTILHLLLEHLGTLPEDRRPATVPHILALAEELPEHTDQIAAEALAVLAAAPLAHVFAPGTLAEIPVSADIAPVGRINGIIDRLIVTEDTVIAADFKTNRTVPRRPEDVPDGLLRQMGAYAAALAQIWPDKRIETGLIWTATQEWMALPHDLVSSALERSTTA